MILDLCLVVTRFCSQDLFDLLDPLNYECDQRLSTLIHKTLLNGQMNPSLDMTWKPNLALTPSHTSTRSLPLVQLGQTKKNSY